MAVRTYRTAVGPFSILVGDEEYERYSTFSPTTGILTSGSKLNEDGNKVKSELSELTYLRFVCLCPDISQVDPTVLKKLKLIVSNYSFVNYQFPTYPSTSTTYWNVATDSEDTSEQRKVKIRGFKDPDREGVTAYQDLVIGSREVYYNATIYSWTAGQLPGSIYDSFGATLYVFDEDFERGVRITVGRASNEPLNLKPIGFNIVAMSSSEVESFEEFLELAIDVNGDPLAGSGTSTPGGGDGTFDFSSTPIDYPALPTIGAYDTGFINIYVPTAYELRQLSAYMWSGSFDLDNWKKLWADPMDAIMGLSILPVSASQIGVQSTQISVGNISTGISTNKATSQYVSVDCGTVEILPKWGAYLDFAPYSKLQLYLPYIGFVDIAPDDVMNGTIGVQYHIDILSGTCIAFVKAKDHVIYEFGGSCSCQCPVTEGQYKNGLFGVLDMISGISQLVSAGQASAPTKKSKSIASNIPGALPEAIDAVEGMVGTVQSMIKPHVGRSGAVGGSAGLMGYQMPYLVLTIPHMCIPGDQNKYMGYPSFITMFMSDLTGYTEINVTHLENMSCTDAEAAEILSLLSSGVIF